MVDENGIELGPRTGTWGALTWPANRTGGGTPPSSGPSALRMWSARSHRHLPPGLEPRNGVGSLPTWQKQSKTYLADLYRNSNFDSTFSLPRYKCGHYARFKKDENSTEYETAIIHCQWNKTWSLEELHPCSCKLWFLCFESGSQKIFIHSNDFVSGSHCPVVPQPPMESNLVFIPINGSGLNLMTGNLIKC